MKKILTTLFVVLSLGCTNTQQFFSSTQGQALLTGSESLAKVAVQAAATQYGGPLAGQLAGAGLDALGSVLQGYVGRTVPQTVVKASPGVASVGAAIMSMISNTKPITQADVNAVFHAAVIATK